MKKGQPPAQLLKLLLPTSRDVEAPEAQMKKKFFASFFKKESLPYLPSYAVNAIGSMRMPQRRGMRQRADHFSALPTGESWGQVLFPMSNNPDLSTAKREQILGGTARQGLDWQVQVKNS